MYYFFSRNNPLKNQAKKIVDNLTISFVLLGYIRCDLHYHITIIILLKLHY